MKKIALFFLVLLPYFSLATHERAGEITFRHISGYTYEFSITTYTKGSSTPADRCSLSINFGDDTAHYTACRSNFMPGDPTTDAFGASCGNQECATHHMGEWGYQCNPAFTLESINVKKNIYTITHTYPGPGTYVISMVDPNRNSCVQNIPSDNTPFAIQDTLRINPFLGFDNSPILSNCPIDKACAGDCFTHNPGASDPDGDSLSFKLGTCFEDVGTPVQGYVIPSGVSINPVTGDFTWCSPPAVHNQCNEPCDEYNFAIDIEEWRKLGNKYYLIGVVRRDFQVRVCNCLNHPPVISQVKDTCILANTNLTYSVTATDTIENDGIQSFTASGGPFNATPPATFTTNFNPPATPVTGVFSWTPSCGEVRKQPYLVTLKAVDDGAPDNVPLTFYRSFYIQVIAPSPKNLSAIPNCNSFDLTWDTAFCNASNNPVVKYKIYRKTIFPPLTCDTLKHDYCETGMPSSWNYALLATVNANITSYTDASNLAPGNIYSYRVVAVYFDGSESYVSDPFCTKLTRNMPLITNVDVISTDASNGKINVKWIKPTADKLTGLDTGAVFGPYTFDLLRATGYGNPLPPAIASATSNFFATLTFTSYLDSGLNTLTDPYDYRVDFKTSSNKTCPTQNASSVFISCGPNNHRITLTWNEKVPWTNYEYVIYKFDGTNWDSIGHTSLQSYTDSNLVNKQTYCYKIKSIGAYADTSLPHPLINWSQELCCIPWKYNPPCPRSLKVDSSCALNQNLLTWNTPGNTICDEALAYYIIYHTPVQNGEYSVLDTIHDINTTSFLDDSLSSIAGCYAVVAVDSFGNQSAFTSVCVDNCPDYQLPNVFSPNGDGSNDFFTPLHPYKFVKDIDIKIYNRWGTEVFHTNNPEILWDGTSEQTKMACSEGVYYYVCIVNDIRLQGIIPRALKGYVTLLRNK